MGPICLLVDMDGSCKGKEAWGETEIMEFDKHAKELIQNAIVQ